MTFRGILAFLQLVGRVTFLRDELVGLVRDILAMKGEFIKAFHKHRQERYRDLSEGFLWHSTCQDNTIGRMWQVHVSAIMTRRTRFFGGTGACPTFFSNSVFCPCALLHFCLLNSSFSILSFYHHEIQATKISPFQLRPVSAQIPLAI